MGLIKGISEPHKPNDRVHRDIIAFGPANRKPTRRREFLTGETAAISSLANRRVCKYV